MRKLGRSMVVGVASVALTLGILALGTQVEAAGGCICPKIYAPVTCSNGRTYTNACVAQCNHATGCVSIPGYSFHVPVLGKRSVVDEDQPNSN